jgi:hypothetical protein
MLCEFIYCYTCGSLAILRLAEHRDSYPSPAVMDTEEK